MSDLLVSQLSKTYPTRSEPLSVLADVSLQLARGENLAITGPSGSGKSTLLLILGTLEQPTSGSIELAGQNPFALSEQALATFRNEQIGFVFQEHYLLPQCSVLENVLLPTVAQGGSTPPQVERARQLIDRVGLTSRIDHRPAELSGGERQRAAIARALLLKPVLVLADEPTGNLDRMNAQLIAELLLELHREENSMLVVVTHSSELAARMQRQAEFSAGKLELI